jgi:signal transduction histidine kinase
VLSGAPLSQRLALTAAVIAAYAAAFPFLAATLGYKASYASFVPAVIAPALLGVRTGMAAAAAVIVCSTALGVTLGLHGWAFPFTGAKALSTVGLLLMAGIAGEVHDLSERLQEQLMRQEELEPKVDRLARENELLTGLVRAAAASEDLSSVMEATRRSMAGFMRFDRFEAVALEPETGALRLISASGHGVASFVPGKVFSLPENSAWRARGAPQTLSLSDCGPAWDEGCNWQASGLVSCLTVPLIARNTVVGAVALGAKEQGAFNEMDLLAAAQAGRQVGPAVMAVRLLDDERKLRLKLDDQNHRLAASNEAKTRFLSAVNHEMKTPLAIMVGFAELMRMNAGGNLTQQQVEQLTMIERNGRRLNMIVSDLADISKIESGQFSLKREPVEVVSLLAEVLDSFDPILKGKKQFLTSSLPEPPQTVLIDRERLAQVVTNLISNASKYSGEGAVVHVMASVEGDVFKVSITDQGMGMSEESLSKLFTPFFRVKDDRTRGIPGTGLGLHLCRSIVEMHGGHISVESAEGKGSTFTVAVPGVVHGELADQAVPANAGAQRLHRAVRFRETVDAAA